MKIEVNGASHEVQAATVAGVLAELGWGEARVATALNGAFVPKAARGTMAVTEGDRLEVLAPMQGG
ncbi:sulfur carrier protein ThiS [Pseudotabrizicola alkalilacus]|uniref:Sulfur carrier protein ThiS n=1 Tax=Pseudotabrizicola alkalilacus TaxID=2305252 RepID=A0A411Z2I9_9RHOB|nr:sulfur carrier protein ThiS [Pseudotabrizicola alkalilacus]RGP37286.1 sulfur carrier protein ThiS [Pseudotabrizicola alkalilacus]